MLKNEIFMNIPKYFLFSFTQFYILNLKEFNTFTNSIIVKGAKLLHCIKYYLETHLNKPYHNTNNQKHIQIPKRHH